MNRKLRIFVIPFSDFMRSFCNERAYFFFSFLPGGATIVSIHQHPLNGTIDLTVTHPSFPSVPEGQPPRRAMVFVREGEDAGNRGLVEFCE